MNFPSGENLTQKTSDVLSEMVIFGTNLYFLELFSESSIRILILMSSETFDIY